MSWPLGSARSIAKRTVSSTKESLRSSAVRFGHARMRAHVAAASFVVRFSEIDVSCAAAVASTRASATVKSLYVFKDVTRGQRRRTWAMSAT